MRRNPSPTAAPVSDGRRDQPSGAELGTPEARAIAPSSFRRASTSTCWEDHQDERDPSGEIFIGYVRRDEDLRLQLFNAAGEGFDLWMPWEEAETLVKTIQHAHCGGQRIGFSGSLRIKPSEVEG